MTVGIRFEHAPHSRGFRVCRGECFFDDPQIVTQVREVYFSACRSNRIGRSCSSRTKDAYRRAIRAVMMTKLQAGGPVFRELRSHVVCRYVYAPDGANIPTKIVCHSNCTRFVT